MMRKGLLLTLDGNVSIALANACHTYYQLTGSNAHGFQIQLSDKDLLPAACSKIMYLLKSQCVPGMMQVI